MRVAGEVDLIARLKPKTHRADMPFQATGWCSFFFDLLLLLITLLAARETRSDQILLQMSCYGRPGATTYNTRDNYA